MNGANDVTPTSQPSRLAVFLLIYIALAAIALGANPFKGQTVGPFDLLVNQPGWLATPHSSDIRNNQRSDILDSLLPQWLHARKQIREGHIPTWNPLPKGGRSGIQNLTSGELTPAFALFTLGATPAFGLYLATLFNLVAAGFGAHLWLSRNIKPAAAMFGGITVMLCGFHAGWLYWPHTLTSIWICWSLWATDRWCKDSTPRTLVPVIITLALMIVGGFPFITLLGLGAVALYVLILIAGARSKHPIRFCAGMVAALAIAMAVCAIPLIVFIDWLGAMDLGYRHTDAGSALRFWRDATLLLPDAAKVAPSVERAIYVGLLPLLLAPVGAIMLLRRRRSVIAWFALSLVVVGATLVFQLVPVSALSWVPGLSNNPWSRAIILLDIGLAATAAWGLHSLLETFGSGRIVVTAALLACGYQSFDQISYFRLFNGPVASAYFYPPTPLISRVQDSIRPFQSVIVDNNFLVSGTLGAYGLPDWLAHAFAAPELRPVLAQLADDPFTTRTATRIEGYSYHLDSPVMRVLGVRYALISENSLLKRVPLRVSNGKVAKRQPLPPLPTHQWNQAFQLGQQSCIQAVDVRLATYARANLHGEVQLQLVSTSDGEIKGTTSVPASDIRDNALQPFDLPALTCLAPGEYAIQIKYRDEGPSEKLTVWAFSGTGAGCSLLVDNALFGGCMDLQLMEPRPDESQFKVIAKDHGIYLLENMQAPSGAYFLRELSKIPDASSGNLVDTSIKHAEDFSVSYRGNASGFVVIPMLWSSGWEARINGKRASVTKYYGALPAIAVSGPTQIRISYTPKGLGLGAAITLAGLLALAALLLWPPNAGTKRLPRDHQ